MSTPFDNASKTAVDLFLSNIKREELAGTDIDARKLAALWRYAVGMAEIRDSRKPVSFFDRDRSACISDETWGLFTGLVNDAVGDGDQISEGRLRRIFDNAAQRAYFDSVTC